MKALKYKSYSYFHCFEFQLVNTSELHFDVLLLTETFLLRFQAQSPPKADVRSCGFLSALQFWGFRVVLPQLFPTFTE